MEKQIYESPFVFVLDIETEGAICYLSGDGTEKYTPGGNYGDDLFN